MRCHNLSNDQIARRQRMKYSHHSLKANESDRIFFNCFFLNQSVGTTLAPFITWVAGASAIQRAIITLQKDIALDKSTVYNKDEII